MASNHIKPSFRYVNRQKNDEDENIIELNKQRSFLSRTMIEKDKSYLKLYKTIPSDLKPWNNTTFDSVYTLKQIKKSDSAYNKIIVKIQESGELKRLRIISIEKLNNPYLSALYELKKLEAKRVYKKNLQELKMYHGTPGRNSACICKENFDYRLCGTSRGVKYGQGVSFSPHFFYAKCFCNKGSQSKKVIFLCDVLFARAHVGTENTEVPLPGYDTTIRDEKQVFVKYDDDTFIPRYKISFILKY